MAVLQNSTLPIESGDNKLEQIIATYDDRQLLWLSGYLYGLAQQKTDNRVSSDVVYRSPVGTPSVTTVTNGNVAVAVKPTKVTILYGSQSGNSKKAANQAAEALKGAGSEVVVADMSEYKPAQLKNEKLLLFVVATYGEGEPPAAAEELHKFIFSSRAPKLSADTQFAVLALGDKSYLQYCQTGKDFDQQLEKLGAKRIADRVDCDVDWHDDAEKWINTVVSKLPKPTNGVASNGNGQTHLTAMKAEAPVSKYDRKNPFEAEILEKIQLNGRGSVKETWHVELSLDGSDLVYEPGDALNVFATNSERLVADVLKTSKLDPSVLVDFGGEKLKLGDVLLEKAELSVLTRDVLQKYYDFTKNDKLKALLADPKALQAYIYGRDVADLFVDFPADVSPQYFADFLRKMPARAYSIASSLAAHEDEVHLTVGAVRYNFRGRKKEGVASSFLADRVSIGEKVKVFVEKNEFFKLPKDPSADIIMVGPGTGIAPFRAFVEERVETGANGKNWLFFGNPNFTTDFLYQTEWQQYLKKGGLDRLDLAFSRDQKNKIYVQDRLLQKSKGIFERLQNGAYFYVCGDKNRMAKDVEQVLVQIAIKEGGFSEEKALDCVKDLKKQRRYLEDVY
jgi:sulfite reductase (NADPH) flavoprotein alpha-component